MSNTRLRSRNTSFFVKNLQKSKLYDIFLSELRNQLCDLNKILYEKDILNENYWEMLLMIL